MSGQTTIRIDTAIILAGGLGTRLRTVVPDLPKPLAPIAGRPFLHYLLDYWLGQGIKRFILSVGYRAEAIIEQLGDRYGNAHLQYIREDSPQGTGGAFLLATQCLKKEQPVLLLNGDTFFAVDLAAFSAFHAEKGADWSFATFRTAESGRYLGMQINGERQVLHFAKGLTEGWREANGGVYLCMPHRLTNPACPSLSVPLSLENDLFPAWLATGQRFFAYLSNTAFIDIGVPDDYRRAPRIISSHGELTGDTPTS